MGVLDIKDFRKSFPEFVDKDKYTDGMINFWSGIADLQLNSIRWADLRNHGIQLFVAHNITLQAQNVASSAITGGVPGQGSGIMAAESAGQVSINFDTQTSAELEGGN